mmetsp:Transcript_5064/g.11864  ORF Transcript_5064/g.11864 Transcript_5064/m.11864 type:complete len:855 (-) Transcript_5064:88-2652(-)
MSDALHGSSELPPRRPSEDANIFQVVAGEGVTQLGIVPSALPPKPLILRHVEPGSWAEQNGVGIGDELIALNDVRVAETTLTELDNFLRRERPLKLTFISNRVPEIAPITSGELKELKRANTGEIAEYVHMIDSSRSEYKEDESKAPVDERDMLGTWVYGNAYEYTIQQSKDGQLLFEETRVDEDSATIKRVTGTLLRRNAWLVGEISDSEQRQLGWIRLKYVEENGTVLSSVRLANEDDWSANTIAIRKDHEFESAEVEEKEREAEPQVPRAQGQVVDGNPVWPEQWGITRAQCRALLQRLRDDPRWDSRNNVYTLVSDFLVPWTRGTGMSYALFENRSHPQDVNVMVSHSWGENAEEFLASVCRSTNNWDGMFIYALSMYHAEDAIGPSIKEQCGQSLEEGPCHKALEHIRERGHTSRCCWRWHNCGHSVAVLFLLLALVVFYTPIIMWGCVLSIDGEQCFAKRRCASCGTRQAELTTHWKALQPANNSLFDEVIARGAYPATAFCILVAVILWLCLWRCCNYRGRLLAVPGFNSQLYRRLWCMYEVSTAATLGVPVVFADSLAWAGRCSSRQAACTEQADRENIRKTIEQGDEDGYRRIDRILRMTLLRQQVMFLAFVLRWAVPLVIVRCADQRLLAASAGNPAGLSDLAAGLGVLAGTACSCVVMYATARLARGAPRCWAVLLAVVVLVCSAVACVGGLIALEEELRLEPPGNWIDGFNVFSDECFGYLHGNLRDDCSSKIRFWGACTQTLLLGGLFLLILLCGALCCDRCKFMALPMLVIFALAAAAALLTTTVYGESGLPEQEYWFSVVVFYLTALFSRSFTPILAMWAGVSRWGIRLHSRRHRSKTV